MRPRARAAVFFLLVAAEIVGFILCVTVNHWWLVAGLATSVLASWFACAPYGIWPYRPLSVADFSTDEPSTGTTEQDEQR